MSSDIAVSSLTALGGVGQVALTAIAAPPAGMACLSYMLFAKIEFWASATNSIGSASLIGDSDVGIVVHGGLSSNVTRYYWARAIDPDGNEGAFYPSGSGVDATTPSTALGPNSIGPDELQSNAVKTTHVDDAQITDVKVLSVSADKITAGTITATISLNSPNINGGLIVGSTFRTSSSGGRIEISGLGNTLIASDNSNRARVRFGGGGITAMLVDNHDNAVCFQAVANVDGANAHAIRGISSAGHGIVGIAAAGGGHAFYASSGGYAPFTGVHPGLMLKPDVSLIGDILIDGKVLARMSINDTVTEVGISETAEQAGVIGVLSHRQPYETGGLINTLTGNVFQPGFIAKYDLVSINSLGEGQMNVCGLNGDIAKGDLIVTSALPGKGQRQDDNIVRSITVAKARENISFDNPSQVKFMSCIYLAG